MTVVARADKSIVDSAKPPGLDCPDCSRRLRWTQIDLGHSFHCPGCGSSLCFPRSYTTWSAFYSLCLTGVLAYGLGARGWGLMVAVLLGFFPLAVVTSAIARRVLPPKLIFSDDYLTHLKDID
jgi:hypothetical protein